MLTSDRDESSIHQFIHKNINLQQSSATLGSLGSDDFNSATYLAHRECQPPLSTRRHHKEIYEFARNQSSKIRKEREFMLSESVDKIFSSLWISTNEILCGTKNNKLLFLNAINGKSSEVELRINMPRTHDALVRSNTASPGSDNSARSFQRDPLRGIYTIALSPDKTMIAIANDNSDDRGFFIHIYQFPSLSHTASLIGHNDLIFKIHWIDNLKLISASRDTTIKIWDLASLYPYESPKMVRLFEFAYTGYGHTRKVRDLTPPYQKESASLSADVTVRLWDLNTTTTKSSIPLLHQSELICIATNKSSLFAVGSQKHITLIDSRCGSTVSTIKSLDEGWGVRALDFSSNLLTIGGGLGKLAFYDTRASKYLSWPTEVSLNYEPKRRNLFNILPPPTLSITSKKEAASYQEFYSSGVGQLIHNHAYRTFHQGSIINQGICTLAYDDTYSRLFTAGGPLQVSLKGSYAALW